MDAQQSEHRPHHWQVSPGCTSTDDLCARDLSHSTLRFVLAAAGQHLANPVRRGPVRQSHQIVVAGPEGMDGCPMSGSRAAPAVLNDPKAGTSACDRFQQPVGEAPVEAGDGARQRHTPTLPARVAQGSMSHNARYVKLLAGPPATRLQRNTSSNSEKVQIPDAVDLVKNLFRSVPGADPEAAIADQPTGSAIQPCGPIEVVTYKCPEGLVRATQHRYRTATPDKRTYVRCYHPRRLPTAYPGRRRRIAIMRRRSGRSGPNIRVERRAYLSLQCDRAARSRR